MINSYLYFNLIFSMLFFGKKQELDKKEYNEHLKMFIKVTLRYIG